MESVPNLCFNIFSGLFLCQPFACTMALRIAVLFLLNQLLHGAFCQQHPASGIEKSIFGWELRGHTYQTMMAELGPDCVIACRRDQRCQSFNFVISVGKCEFNNRTKEAKPEDFVQDQSRFYYRRAMKRGILLQSKVVVLCCVVLCCVVLCCVVLCCVVLCCAVLCCAVLCCVLCCAVLCCAVLCCVVLCCVVLCCVMLCCAALCSVGLCCCCVVLCCVVLCCVALCCVVSCRVVSCSLAQLCCFVLCCVVLCC